MTKTLAALIATAFALPALADDSPFAGLKGKVRDGNWEYTMQMDGVPGMPAGMTMPPMTFQRCLKPADVEKGGFAQKDGKMPDGCTVKDMKFTPGGASWRMECTKDPKMIVDSTMTANQDAFTMKQVMQIDRGGQMMKMNQTMSGKYLGPCK